MRADMDVIACISQKGGSGKTTLSTNLAVVASSRGLQALIVDLDPQASATNWADGREAESPVVASTPPSRLAHLLQVTRDNDHAGVVLIDTAPHADRPALFAAKAADLVLIPVRPAYFDLAAMEDTAAIAELAGTRAIVVLNGTPPHEPRIEDASQAIAASGLAVAPARLGNRVAFQDAAAAGAGVLEHQPAGKAAAEISALYDFITEQLT